ncbi:MAG: SHOCT domain-containing protein [Caldilineaceae bacterium]|nr:SHOCT domain-containing protein [Caldilineaceae bacterium]
MWLSILILVGAVVWAFVYMSNSRGGRDDGPYTEHRTALDVLQERYARGEITREEYEQMRRDLS